LACLEIELRRYRRAREHLDELDRFFPLLDRDKEMTQWVAARRSDAAYYCDDYEQAVALARTVDNPFYKSLAEYLAENADRGRRVELKVGFVHQHYATCSPATLSAICRYWQRPVDHVELAESICYDGTPDHNERHWVEEHGFCAREFRVTWESARALIDAGIPFTLTTVMPGSAHLQAVFGYDSRRGVLLVRDPNERHFTECLAEKMIECQTSTGPRGMAFVPRGEEARLRAMDLPDADFYDDYYTLQRALYGHDRQTAEEACRRMTDRNAEHRLALHGRARIAAYDADHVTLRKCTEQLLAKFPDDVNQQMAKLRLLQENGTRQQRLELLEQICARPEFDPMFRRQYAEELLADGRQLEQAAYLTRRALRARPVDAENFRLLANICWARQDRRQALRLLRFAACLEERNEARAMSYFSASRFLNRTDEALRFLKDRFRRLGSRKSWPAETLCAAYEQLEQQEEALEVLDQALKLRPDDGELMLLAARHYSRLHRDEQATRLLDEAKDRCHPLAWLQAMAYRAWVRNDLARALEYGREVLEAAPFHQDVNEMVAGVLHNLQGPEAAEEHLRALVDRFPFHHGLRVRLIEALAEDDPARKEREVRKFLELHPEDPWARRELAFLLARQQRFEEAMTEARAALASDESNPAGQFACAVIHEGKNEPDKARLCCRRALELSVDYEPAIYKLMELCRSKAERQEALRFVYDQLVDQVIFGDGLLTFSAVADRTLEAERLLEILREGLEAREDLWQAWSAVVWQLIGMDRSQEAVETAAAALDRFPLLPRASLDLAAAWRAVGERGREIAAIEKALTLNPAWGEALRQLCDAQRAAGDFEAAQATLRKAIAQEPQNVTHQGELADLLWTQGQRSEAIDAMKEAVAREPGYQWGWRKLRDWSHVVRDPEMVVDLGREIVHKRPQSAACWMLLAEILEDSPEHWDECLKTIDRTLELEPRRVEAHALRADLLARVGQFDEAVAACRPQVFSAERPAFLRVKEADIESQRGNVEEAVEQMKSVVADDPEYAIGWSRLADWYDSLGDHENYLHAAENLVRIDPRHPVAWGYLGDGMLRAGRRDEAKRHLRKALDLDAAYVFAALRLFELHLEDREYDEALSAIGTAAPQLPDDLRLASEVRALAAKRDSEGAKRQLASLCRCKMEDADLLQQAVEAMWQTSAVEAEEVLAEALEDPQASPLVAAAWVTRAARNGKHRLIRKKLRALADGDDRWHVLSRAYLSQLAERRQPMRLRTFVRRHRAKLHGDTQSWAAVASALRDLSQDKQVIRWMADWRTRSGLQARMLFPLVLSHLADRSEPRAAEVANHALSLTVDNSFDFYLIWLSAIGLLTGEIDAAVAQFSRIKPSRYTDYYQQLYGLLKATFEVLIGEPDRANWPAARRQLSAARSQIRPDYWADRVIQRLYWRCRELAARHCGKPLPAFWARLARMLR
jgi:tetratricopeptide (TPR) repeat protein